MAAGFAWMDGWIDPRTPNRTEPIGGAFIDGKTRRVIREDDVCLSVEASECISLSLFKRYDDETLWLRIQSKHTQEGKVSFSIEI